MSKKVFDPNEIENYASGDSIVASPAQESALAMIADKTAAMHKLIEEMKEIADRYKLAFYLNIESVHNEYVPEGGGVNKYGEWTTGYDGWTGWQSSMC